jgi:hypothetical protein
MILFFILFVFLLQITLYVMLDKKNASKWKYAVLGTIFLSHFFVFPQIFVSSLIPEGIDCGLPVMGIVFGFWIFGGSITLLGHLVYQSIFNAIVREE